MRPLGAQVAVLSVGRGIAAATSMAWLLSAAHLISVVSFGDLTLLLSLGGIFTLVADLGLPYVLTAAVSQRPAVARQAVALVARRRVLAGCVAAALLIPTYLVAAADRSPVIPLVYGLSLVSTAGYSTVYAGLRGLGRPRVEAINEVVSRIGVLAVGIIWLRHGGGLLAAITVYALADIASAAVLGALAYVALPRTGQSIDLQLLSVRRLWPLAVAGVVGTIYFRIDIWLVAILRTPVAVALYAGCYRIFDGLMLPANAAASLVLGSVAPLEREERVQAVRRLAVVIGVLSGLAGLVVAAAAEPILRLALGSPFAAASDTLRLLMLGAVPMAVGAVYAPVVAVQQRRAFLALMTVGLVLNVGANLVLIPRLGINGAAVATLSAQLVLAAGLVAWLERRPAPDRTLA